MSGSAARTEEDRTYTSEEIAWAIRRLDMAMSRLMVTMAHSLDVSVPELLALDYITASEGVGPSEVARRLHLTTGTLTALVDRLEQRGHLVRERHPDDRRRVMLRTTSSADAEVGERVWPMAADILALAESLEATERQAVGRFLDEFIALLERHADKACPPSPRPGNHPRETEQP
jgi:DNA-binding MarR family transcriptional regulator